MFVNTKAAASDAAALQDRKTSSEADRIFTSLDGVAIDSVGFEFGMADLPDNTNTDNYLREAALAKDAWPNSIEGSHLP